MKRAANEYKVIQTLEKVLRTAHKNDVCLYQQCKERPIGSHIIARKTLRLIAEKGHVKTWLQTSAWDMMRHLQAGQSLDHLLEAPVNIGITDTNKVTLPLFCQKHDNQVFTSLEKDEFSFQPEQIVLLAYRALCSMTLGVSSTAKVLSVARQFGYRHSLNEPEQFQRLQRFQMTDLMVNVRQHYAKLHATYGYDQLGWSVYLVNIQPCVAATYTLIPVNDDDAQAIVNGSQTVTIEDAVSFSLLPYQPLRNSVCVISWLKGSQRARQFMMLNGINEVPEKERDNHFLRLAFESPTLYISPAWWESLSDEERKEYSRIHHNAGREHAKLV